MNRKRKAIIEGNEISEMLTLSLGGYEQKVLIDGKRKDLPVLVTLHGGPGMPLPMAEGCRGLLPDFTEHFIMVYWDQLGCGINNAIIDENFRIADFVDMAVDLVKAMRRKFPQNKLYLFGTSWGSVLCLQTVNRLTNEDDSRGVQQDDSRHMKQDDSRRMQQIDAAVVWGQIITKPICNQAVYDELEKKKLSKSDRNRLKQIQKQPVNLDTIKFTAGCINRYTYGYMNKLGRKAPMGAMVWGLLTSPDYTLGDVKALFKNGSSNNQSIWQELSHIDMTDILKKVSVPYCILQGDTDIVTNTAEVVDLVNNADNNYLKCRVVQNSGHIPGADGMDAALEALICLK